MSDSVRPHRRQPTRLPHPWDSPGKNTGVGCHFLLQCINVKSESEVAQSHLTLRDPMDCSLPGSSVHGIFQARVLEWGAIAFSECCYERGSNQGIASPSCCKAWSGGSDVIPCLCEAVLLICIHLFPLETLGEHFTASLFLQLQCYKGLFFYSFRFMV